MLMFDHVAGEVEFDAVRIFISNDVEHGLKCIEDRYLVVLAHLMRVVDQEDLAFVNM